MTISAERSSVKDEFGARKLGAIARNFELAINFGGESKAGFLSNLIFVTKNL